MRILTWNVYFGGHCFDERADALVAELERRRPDVIALQEVTPELLPRLAALAGGYELSDADGATLDLGYGVVIGARAPVRGYRFVDLPTEMGRTLVTAELDTGLTVAAVHLESMASGGPRRLDQLAVIQRYLARRDDVLWVGDMNFPPDGPEQVAVDPGWLDVWPSLHPDDPGYTVDTERNAMRLQLHSSLTRKRIDRVFLRSARWRATAIEQVGTAPIDERGTFVSDHFGLEVELASYS